MAVANTSLLAAVVWGAPALCRELEKTGIVATDASAAQVALVRIDADRDLWRLRRMHTDNPGLPIVAMLAVNAEQAGLAIRAVELGASGVVTEETRAVDVAAALANVADGHPFIAPPAMRLLVQALQARREARATFGLTSRQRDVLVELVAGYTTAEIADRLGIRFGTAQTHIKAIYRKLEVSSKAAATAVALRHQLV